MAGPGFISVESESIGRLVLFLPVEGQKVKGIGPGSLEANLRSREQEPAGTTDRTAITARLGHDVDARL